MNNIEKQVPRESRKKDNKAFLQSIYEGLDETAFEIVVPAKTSN
jgi:transcriptional/translational regulatory protein YebC/TACO1